MEFSLDEFLKAGHKATFKKNDFLLEQGQISKKVYFIIHGITRHFLLEESGAEKTIRLSKENDFFYSSHISFFQNLPSYINCQALTNIELLYWEAHELEALGSKSIEFLLFENQKLKEFITEKHIKEIARLTKSAGERLEAFNKYNEGLFNRIPHHIIASYLDMTPETLSRLRAKKG